MKRGLDMARGGLDRQGRRFGNIDFLDLDLYGLVGKLVGVQIRCSGGLFRFGRRAPYAAAFGAAHFSAARTEVRRLDLIGGFTIRTNDEHACRESPSR
jgi:hypothetical protein